MYDDTGRFVGLSSLMRGVTFPITFGADYEGAAEKVPGTVFYAGFLYHDHFGHFLTESLSRFWYLFYSGEKIRPVFNTIPGIRELSDMNKFFLNKLGVNSEDVLLIDRPLRFENVIVPRAGFELGNPNYVLEQLNVFKHISSAQLNAFDGLDKSAPVYVSRTKFNNRKIHGEQYLEGVLKYNGWNIVHPEMHSLSDQISIFNSSNIYCGVLGSAMHNLLFSNEGKRPIYIERTRGTPHTLMAFKCADEMLGHNSLYIDASNNLLPTYGQRGPFLIDPEKVLRELRNIGLINSSYPPFNYNEVERQYREDWETYT
ncbi:glycosyltransferase family 61 protein [Asticcacaulis excentricus]|uniref:glycosyltransferase family 61 protein n=1 Tax=Asticcacaulis excentricus TaxID=78587 RepID=UPI001562156A|nr:glycosyltransferase family 61 protein [Asticcacaulis excentricus]